MKSQQYKDTRTGEIVTQVPISEIEHFEEYNEPPAAPATLAQLAGQLRALGYRVEMTEAELQTLKESADLIDATERARNAASSDSAAVLFGYAKAMGFEPDEVGGYVRVFFENHYISGGPGYVGRVAIILFDGGDDPAVTMRWDKQQGEWVPW
jgi:hypothetical protein